MTVIRKYEHLFFDLDNTLWDFDANAKSALHQTVAELKLDQQIEDFGTFYSFYEEVNTRLWEAYRRQEIRKPELIRERFRITLENFGLAATDPVEVNDHYLRIMPSYTQLIEGTIETLDWLRARNYHLHIITNGFKEVQSLKMKNSGLTPYFERVFVSEEVNAPKPDKRIFRHALMNCNARKSRSLMIGDSWETDILGAKQFGMHQVYFCRNMQNFLSPPQKDPATIQKQKILQNTPQKDTIVIKNLTSLMDFL